MDLDYAEQNMSACSNSAFSSCFCWEVTKSAALQVLVHLGLISLDLSRVSTQRSGAFQVPRTTYKELDGSSIPSWSAGAIQPGDSFLLLCADLAAQFCFMMNHANV